MCGKGFRVWSGGMLVETSVSGFISLQFYCESG